MLQVIYTTIDKNDEETTCIGITIVTVNIHTVDKNEDILSQSKKMRRQTWGVEGKEGGFTSHPFLASRKRGLVVFRDREELAFG